MNIRTPLLKGSKQSPATENLAEGPLVAVVTFVQTPVSTLRSEMKGLYKKSQFNQIFIKTITLPISEHHMRID